MLKNLYDKLDKRQKSNLFCMIVAFGLLGMIINKHQSQCVTQAYGQQKLSNKTLQKFSNVCVTGPYSEFAPPSEVGAIIGGSGMPAREFRSAHYIQTRKAQPAPRYYRQQ